MTALSREKHPATKGPLTYLLGSLVSLPTLSMTLIAPALPAVRADFGASYNQAQLLITTFLIAMAVGLLFVGLLSDRFGRRPAFLTGTFLFFLGSLMGVFAPNTVILIIARLLQGLGASALMVTGRIIANDVYAAKDASRALSSITAVQTLMPVIALSLGGLIVEYLGWRATFGMMALAAALVLTQSYLLIAETNQNKLANLRITALFDAFRTVLTARNWQIYSICAGMQIGMFYSMNGYMSYHFVRLGASITAFGFYYAMISVGYLIGNLVNRKYGGIASLGQWVLYGSLLTLIAIAMIWTLDEMALLTPPLLSFLLCVIGFSHGILVANAIISSMQNMGAHSGSASGLGATTHMLIGGASGSIIILLGGATDFAVCMSINGAMALISVIAAKRGLHH